MAKLSHHVAPSVNGGWSVRRGGAARASRVFDTQAEAVDYAKTLAKKNGSDLYIHGKDGMVRSKSSYGEDPHPARDRS